MNGYKKHVKVVNPKDLYYLIQFIGIYTNIHVFLFLVIVHGFAKQRHVFNRFGEQLKKNAWKVMNTELLRKGI